MATTKKQHQQTKHKPPQNKTTPGNKHQQAPITNAILTPLKSNTTPTTTKTRKQHNTYTSSTTKTKEIQKHIKAITPENI